MAFLLSSACSAWLRLSSGNTKTKPPASAGKYAAAIVILLLLAVAAYAARLPTVGGDIDSWGDVLNEYLLLQHNSTGGHINVTTDNINVTGTAILAREGGKVGINTSSPTQLLTVVGDINASNGSMMFYNEIMPDGATCSNGQILKKTASNDWDCAADDSGAANTGWATTANTLYNDTNGVRVGINTSTPTQTLTVMGTLNVTSENIVGIFVNASRGNVGIGTGAPTAKLTVGGSITNPDIATVWIDHAGNVKDGVRITYSNNAGGDLSSAALNITNAGSGGYTFVANDQTNDLTPFVIANDGFVGINTSSPQQPLHVVGNANITGTVYLSGSDVAERIKVKGGAEPGDVVIIDDSPETVRKSEKAYDTRVAGVVSTDAATILGSSQSGVPLALAGRVPVKATNENGPIRPGDLLTTSSKPGYAMKCLDRCAGAIIGKALQSLDGEGKITALIALG